MITARLMPVHEQARRVQILDILPSGSPRHDRLCLSPEDARRLGHELIAAADKAAIETTGGVPPSIGA